MFRKVVLLFTLLGTSIAAAQSQEKPKPAEPAQPEKSKPEPKAESKDGGGKSGDAAADRTSPLDFQVKDIDGNDVKLSAFKGKVVMIVNVASKCGLTKQYAQLQQLHERYGERGLAILAFPANNFMGQEPGTNAEIKEFCAKEFSIGFTLFSKVSVKGDDICPLYKWLTAKETNPDFGGEIKWNFTKFLVDREGKVVSRFEPKVKPDAKEIIESIEKALGEKKE